MASVAEVANGYGYGVPESTPAGFCVFLSDTDPDPVSSEIPDLCEISDLLLLLGYCVSQNKVIEFGNYFLDMCCVN